MGMFKDGRYFDVVQKVAKRSPEDLLWRITVTNHGPVAAPVHVLPTLWFRNVWSWGEHRETPVRKQLITGDGTRVTAWHETLGEYKFMVESPDSRHSAKWLFTENETNTESFGGPPNATPHVKDAFHRHLIHGEKGAVSPVPSGTKAAAHLSFNVPPGKSITIRCLLAIPSEERLRKSLAYMLDPKEFQSDFGIRSLSKAHAAKPFVFAHHGQRHEVPYTPGEATTDMFGGNSNWRGPIWFPTNFLIIEALERYHYFYGDSFRIGYPTGSTGWNRTNEVDFFSEKWI